ncbi:MAG: hypothetical protein ACYDD4_03675 [Acidimicrobiales bacterium]
MGARRGRLAITALALGALGAGCGARTAASLSQGTPELGAGAGSSASGASTGGQAYTPGATTSTTATGSSASAAGGASGNATTTTVSGRSGSKPSGTSGASGELTPAAQGTYTYKQSGSFTVGNSSQPDPPTGTIVVDAASPQGPSSWTQVWHSYVNTQQPPTNQTFLIDQSGIALQSELVQMSYGGQTVSLNCTFSHPIQILPWPVRVGWTFSGSGTCGSNIDVSVSGSITATQQATLDGVAVTTYVVDTTVKTTGQVSSSDSEVDWFDPALRLNVHDESNESGTYGPFPFSAHLTRDLESGHPS